MGISRHASSVAAELKQRQLWCKQRRVVVLTMAVNASDDDDDDDDGAAAAAGVLWDLLREP
jgi:hypothetical protein